MGESIRMAKDIVIKGAKENNLKRGMKAQFSGKNIVKRNICKLREVRA